MKFDKSLALGFMIGYFIVGIGFFPVERNGIMGHFIWIIVGLAGAILMGFSNITKFIKLDKVINKYPEEYPSSPN